MACFKEIAKISLTVRAFSHKSLSAVEKSAVNIDLNAFVVRSVGIAVKVMGSTSKHSYEF